MKVYKTNAGLGFNQSAILIETGEGYLVIDTFNVPVDDFKYRIGKEVDLEDNEIEETEYDISDSPLKGEYLFEFFLQHFNFQ